MPGHSLDNRVPTFIQFTDTNTNRRTSKRRPARLQQGNQQTNKKRKTNTPPRKRRIPLEEKKTDHQHDLVTENDSCNTKADDTSNMDHLEQINNHDAQVTTRITPESPQQSPLSPTLGMNTDDSIERTSTEPSHDDSFEHTSPNYDKNTDDSYEHESNHDKNTDDSYEHESNHGKNTDDSYEHTSPSHDKNTGDSYEHTLPNYDKNTDDSFGHTSPNHDKNTDDLYEHTLSNHDKNTGDSYEPESNHDKLFEQISPNHDSSSIARHLEFNTITLSPDHDRKKLPLPSPQVIAPTESPEHTSNTPSPTTEIRLTPTPLDPFEPSEFYTPTLDTPQDEWTVTRHIKGFFDRIKTGLW